MLQTIEDPGSRRQMLALSMMIVKAPSAERERLHWIDVRISNRRIQGRMNASPSQKEEKSKWNAKRKEKACQCQDKERAEKSENEVNANTSPHHAEKGKKTKGPKKMKSLSSTGSCPTTKSDPKRIRGPLCARAGMQDEDLMRRHRHQRDGGRGDDVIG